MEKKDKFDYEALKRKTPGTAPFREVIIRQRWRICPVAKRHFGGGHGR